MRARAALLAAALLLLPGCASDPPDVSAPSPSTLTVTGKLIVKGDYPAVQVDGIMCGTGGGYTDIREGAQVVVTDESAKTIALGRLGKGAWANTTAECIFFFTVTGVPTGLQFYGIEVSHRGRLQYTAAQLATPLALTIGD